MSSALVRWLVVLGCVIPASAGADEPLIEYLEPSAETGTSAAVLVGKTPLAHTAQILPWKPGGDIVPADRPAEQIEQTLANLKAALEAGGSGFDHLVRLHVCLKRADLAAGVQQQLRRAFPNGVRPAVTWVVGELPHPQALLAIDAVAAAPGSREPAVSHHRADGLPRAGRGADVSLLPTGRTVYVSGQAERADSLAEATRKTLEGLAETLDHLQLDLSHVVQVKSFLRPMSDVEAVDREIAAFFGDQPVPATVHVEWTMSLPIEIELIAWAPDGTAPQAAGNISFITPPGKQASPIFARVVVIRNDRSLYTGGLYGPAGAEAEQEVRGVFGRLGKLLDRAGSDFRHLAKATYYVADDPVSRMLNQVRPDFYDPQRPPAASKAGVRGVASPGRQIAIDMIAIPRER